ncbi:MAG: sigma-E factor regulatory protein RseB domain-containing protein [Chthonomonadales bacterium]
MWKLNISGTETVVAAGMGNRPSRFLMRKVVRSSTGKSIIRWETTNGIGGPIVVEDGIWSKAYDSNLKVTNVTRCPPRSRDAHAIDRQLRLILRNYSVHTQEPAPMAGRDCYVLRLEPRYRHSYQVMLWIDRANFSVLSHQESNHLGETVNVSSFNGIKFLPHIDPKEFAKAIPEGVPLVKFSRSEPAKNIQSLSKLVDFDICMPYIMPGGYEFEYAEVVVTKGQRSTCIRYTDGISEISLFQTRSPTKRAPDYLLKRSGTDGLNNIFFTFEKGPMNFAAVGHLDPAGLDEMFERMNMDQERAFLDYLARNYRIHLTDLETLRDQGLCIDTLNALLEVRKRTGKSLADLLDLNREGHCWQSIAKKYNLDPAPMYKHMSIYSVKQ